MSSASKKLEREKRILADRVENAVPPPGRLNEFIEPAMLFLSSPWKLYENGTFALKRTVLKLAFAQPLRYSRKEGYRTAKITFPFKVLADFLNRKCGLVDLTVEESNHLFTILEDWEVHLAQYDLNDLRCDDDEFAP